jgi:hypothetical protein
VILNSVRHWECPNCNSKDITHEAQPHTRFHACPGLRGITAPMVPAGTKAKVEAREREDYIGKEMVTLDESRRPIMSVITTRDDGQDVAVLAPTATGKGA